MAEIAVVELAVDPSGVERGTKRASDALKGFNQTADEAAHAGTRLGRQFSDIGSSLGGPLGRAFQTVGGSAERLGDSFLSLSNAGGAFGAVALGAVAATAALSAAWIKAALDGSNLAGNILDVSEALGLSVEQTQALDIALKQSGGSIQTAEAGIAAFQQRLVQVTEGGAKQAALALDKFGIDAEKAAQRPEEAFFELGKRLTLVKDQAQRLALAKDLLGRSAVKLVPALMSVSDANSDLNKQLRDSGVLLGSDVVQGADAVGDQMVLLQAQFDATKIQIANDLGPTLINVFKDVAGIISDLQPLISAVSWAVSEMLRGIKQDIADVKGAVSWLKNLNAWMGGAAWGAGGAGAAPGLVPGEHGPPTGGGAGGGLGGGSNLRFQKAKKGADEAKKAAEKAKREAEEWNRRLQQQVDDVAQATEQTTSALNARLLSETLNFLKLQEAATEASYANRLVKGEEYYQELGRIRDDAFAAEMADIERQVEQLQPRLNAGGMLTADQLGAQKELEELLKRRNDLETERLVQLEQQRGAIAEQTRELAKQQEEFRKGAGLIEQEEVLPRAGGGAAITTKFGVLGRVGGERTAAEAEDYEKRKKMYEDSIALLKDYGDQVGAVLGSAFGDALEGANSFFEGVKAGMRSMLADIAAQMAGNAVRFALNSLFGVSQEGGFLKNVFKFRQAGGPVFAGQPYIVGERGPELFVPYQSGNVQANKSGGSAVWNINIGDRREVQTRESREQQVSKFRRMLERSSRYD